MIYKVRIVERCAAEVSVEADTQLEAEASVRASYLDGVYDDEFFGETFVDAVGVVDEQGATLPV